MSKELAQRRDTAPLLKLQRLKLFQSRIEDARCVRRID